MTLMNFQLIVSRLQHRRYWAMLLVFGLICLIFFTDGPVSSDNAVNSLMTALRTSAIFGLFMVALVINMRIVHQSLITPLAAHLWRYRWLYTLVPTFTVGLLILFSSDGGLLNAEIDAQWLINKVAVVFLIFLAIALQISILHAMAMTEWLWLVALLLIWPLAFVFFFYGERYRGS